MKYSNFDKRKEELINEIRKIVKKFNIQPMALNPVSKIGLGNYKPLQRGDVYISFTFGEPFQDWDYAGTPVTFTYYWN